MMIPKSLPAALLLTAFSLIAFAGNNQAANRSLQSTVDDELAFQNRQLSPQRLIISVTDASSGKLLALAASTAGKGHLDVSSRSQWQSFRFDPGITLKEFTPSELISSGISDSRSVSTRDLDRLFGAVANGGLLMPGNVRLFSTERAATLRTHFLDLVEHEHRTLLGGRIDIEIAKVEGVSTAGAAGHSAKKPVTSVFTGFFPAEHPRYVCSVVAKEAKVGPGLNRGGMICAPIFAYIVREMKHAGILQGAE